MGGESVAEAMAILDRAAIPTFSYPDSAARAFCYLWQYTHALRALYETPALAQNAESSATRMQAARSSRRVRKTGRTLLSEPESKELLAAYGIPIVPT